MVVRGEKLSPELPGSSCILFHMGRFSLPHPLTSLIKSFLLSPFFYLSNSHVANFIYQAFHWLSSFLLPRQKAWGLGYNCSSFDCYLIHGLIMEEYYVSSSLSRCTGYADGCGCQYTNVYGHEQLRKGTERKRYYKRLLQRYMEHCY